MVYFLEVKTWGSLLEQNGSVYDQLNCIPFPYHFLWLSWLFPRNSQQLSSLSKVLTKWGPASISLRDKVFEFAVREFCVMMSNLQDRGGSRGWARGARAPLLIWRPKRGPKGRKKKFMRPGPPVISGRSGSATSRQLITQTRLVLLNIFNLHSSLQVDVNFLSIPRSIRADYRSYHTFIPRLRTLKSRWSERKPNNNDSGLFEITSLYFNHLNYKCMMHVRDFPQP